MYPKLSCGWHTMYALYTDTNCCQWQALSYARQGCKVRSLKHACGRLCAVWNVAGYPARTCVVGPHVIKYGTPSALIRANIELCPDCFWICGRFLGFSVSRFPSFSFSRFLGFSVSQVFDIFGVALTPCAQGQMKAKLKATL
jgi:hypothetical protein